MREVFGWGGQRSPLFIFCLFLGAAMPVYFAFTTRLIWEDFFITYRYSENLVHGRGLVFSPGERVYGFTSPLNTLLPALFAALLPSGDFSRPLMLFRLVSLGGLLVAWISVAGALARGIPGGSPARSLVAAVFPLIAALEIKTTGFAMSGQEAGLVLCFLGPAFAVSCLGWRNHVVLGGLLFAGLMYCRPDAPVYIAAIAGAAFTFETGLRRELALAFLKSAAICAVLYLPWFLFTWIYYGSPVPHTLTAKYGTAFYAAGGFGLLAPVVAGFEQWPKVLTYALAPIYDGLGTGPGNWPNWVNDAALALGLFSVLYWLVPTRDRVGRMASFFCFLLSCYLVYASLVSLHCPWYYPPLAFLCLATLASAIASLAERYCARLEAAVGMSGLALFLGFVFFTSLPGLRFKQEVIEWRGRRLVGLWLRDHVPESDSVYLEPIGYIGYFSGCRLLDWPGLVSPAVVEARRQFPPTGENLSWIRVAAALRPPWIVARPPEVEQMRRVGLLAHDYKLVQVFDERGELQKLGPDAAAPGMILDYYDLVFEVFHRTD